MEIDYFMESDKEAQRHDLKTDQDAVAAQAKWAGLTPGMRAVDLGCGSGKATCVLDRLVQPGGEVIGVDYKEERLEHARSNNGSSTLHYQLHDVRQPMGHLGQFDFVWMRFLLEYYRAQAFEIVQNSYKVLRPGGTICLIDLDYNCLSHFGLSAHLEERLKRVLGQLEERHNFDPFAGRRLYSFLYDLGCEQINIDFSAHHLIYGAVKEGDLYNWTCKLEATKPFFDTEAEYRDFFDDFLKFFKDHRRFTYTPLIICKGKKPQ